MKKILFLTVLFTIFVAGCSDNSTDTNALAVRDIQSDPLAFTGELKINGVVTEFLEDDMTLFNLKDTAETLVCLNLICDSFRLPVRYIGGGDVPQLADEIDLIGRWSETEGGIVTFEATGFEVRRNIMRLIERRPN